MIAAKVNLFMKLASESRLGDMPAKATRRTDNWGICHTNTAKLQAKQPARQEASAIERRVAPQVEGAGGLRTE